MVTSSMSVSPKVIKAMESYWSGYPKLHQTEDSAHKALEDSVSNNRIISVFCREKLKSLSANMVTDIMSVSPKVIKAMESY